MSYIGNQSQTAYSALVKQDITGNGGTGYTLSHPVSNENDILLYINNVKQEGGSGKAFTASGTTLTLSEAIANTDSCYVQYIGLAIQTVVPPDGSVGTAKLASSAVDLTSKVTGVLPVANGGTGVSSGFSYSEGTFTPTWDGYTAYSTSGKYVKIGTQVTVYVTLVTNSGTDESLIQINNLPFQVAGNQGGGMVDHNGLGLYAYNINTKFTNNSTICKLFVSSGGAEVGIKYVSGSQPTLGGFSSLIWTLVYQTT